MGGMDKTTVYLSPAQKAALARTAKAEGRSEATLIRAGIDIVTARHRVGERAAPYTAAEPEGGDQSGSARRRPRWVPREVFVAEVVGRQADPGLRAELRELAPDTTDESPLV
jgi:hypothetical protein